MKVSHHSTMIECVVGVFVLMGFSMVTAIALLGSAGAFKGNLIDILAALVR